MLYFAQQRAIIPFVPYCSAFVWMAIFMEVLIDPPIEHGFEISSIALLFGIVLPLPLAGMLSDQWGREKTMALGAVGLGIIGPFMLNVISSGQEMKAFLAQWTIGIFLVLFGGPMNAWLVGKKIGGIARRRPFCSRTVFSTSTPLSAIYRSTCTEKFPAKIRLTSCAFGYDLSHCTASAFSPLVATVLVQQYGVKAPGLIYPFFAVVSLVGMLLSTDVHRCGGIDDTDDVFGDFQPADLGGFEAEAKPRQSPGRAGGVLS